MPATRRAKPIVLVNPPLGRQLVDYPLGLLYIAAVLEREGYEVTFLDLNFASSWEEYRKRIGATDFDIIGFTAMSLYAAEAFTAMKIAKEVNPKCALILGGPHATAMPEECLQESCVDYTVYGEGEETVIELVDALHRGGDVASVRGVYLRGNGAAQFTGPRPPIDDLDSLPLPARHLLSDMARYIGPPGHAMATAMASRGCPGNCSYCQPMVRNLFGRKTRMRSPRNVMDEVVWLVKTHGVKTICFRDDTICTQARWLREFADLMERNSTEVKWWSAARVNNLTPERAMDLRRAGCQSLTFGVESGCQRVLDVLRKGTTVEQARRASALCREHDILFVMAVMIGNPGETREEILQTIKHVKELDPDILDPHITTATPGSHLYYSGIEQGFLQGYDYALLTDREEIAHNFSRVSNDELRELLVLLWREYRCHRRATRTYWRWRLESIVDELSQGHLPMVLWLLAISVLKGDGYVYRLARTVWRMPRRVRQLLANPTGRRTAEIGEHA